jgi:iron complex outermembrane receptor protein
MNKGRLLLILILLSVLSAERLMAQDEQQTEDKTLAASETVQVTATRIPEAVEPEPASITIVTGDQLRATGATDLPTALSLVAGVSIAPGSDGGPASSVPEIWGLREFDAFLLVVDDVPWGGAFNPALATVDLNDIERIEVMRGAAPVMYGATSFVGVIHVIHRAASAPGNSAQAYGGNFSTGGASARFVLPSGEKWKQALAANFDSQGFKDDRTNYNKGHVLYRGETATGEGKFHLDVDLTFLRQDPASPSPRTGPVLSPDVPVDSNQNPSDSRQDENRYHFVGGYNRPVGGSDWAILAAFTRADRDLTKGYLSEVSNDVDPNTAGYRQHQKETDLYLDTHFSWKMQDKGKLLVGADYLYGKGNANGDNFDYFINLDGSNPPNSFDQVVQERPQLEDERNFFGLYSQVEWNPTTRLLIQGGLRFNSTHENRAGEVLPGDAGAEAPSFLQEEATAFSQTNNRLSGTAGVSYLALSNTDNHLWLFADYRNAFKPAALDFGPEVEGGILEPETANSYEAGLKGVSWEDRFRWEVSFFRMDFTNLVTSTVIDGLPALINSGKERFSGVEIGGAVRVYTDTTVQFSYSHHNSEFIDFVQAFDGVPTQLAGKKFEMAPANLAATGLVYSPAKGLNGDFTLNYVGTRFLNKRNTAPADAFTTISLGVGYRFGHNNIRFDGNNLTDQRDPVSESELGDAQYYRLPASTYRIGWQFTF